MTSQRKIEANRRNAKKSTGPRTKEGKARSRLNSVTHGLTAKTHVIACRGHLESDGQFEFLLDQLTSLLKPILDVERDIVRGLALAHWQYLRASHIEKVLQTDPLFYGESSPDILRRALYWKRRYKGKIRRINAEYHFIHGIITRRLQADHEVSDTPETSQPDEAPR